MSAVFRKPKTFRLRALHSQRKFGVAGWSCQEVLQKGCRHFQLPVTGSRLCLYEDGTELTGDYFWGVPDNSELVLLTSGQTWQGYVSDISRLLSAFHKPHAGLIQAAQQLLSDEQAPLRQKLLADLLHTVSENIAAETRAEDPPWFEGLESRFRSKSGYLRYSCESRIRSYLREVNSYASVVGVEAQEEYSRIVDVMCRELRAAQYNGSYFDRGAEAGGRLCTSEGWFCCQGPFDMDTCASKHSINPYGNRESRVLFSTWNLDHIQRSSCPSSGHTAFGNQMVLSAYRTCWGQSRLPSHPFWIHSLPPPGTVLRIEKKRTVVPALAEAVTERNGREVAWEYFYSLLFTSANLKLVHIACHKKTTHKLSCDPRRIYRPQTTPKRRRPARKCQ
uniref:DNA fragmentation factor subunit beta isoform X3 n=1 Tax=Halichoerus grypus TaxID=9711 RepID=UPI001659D296|nr:DNA fragmentation factor subunit beta isoform X3 [Halichoerus grypus]